MRVGDLQFGEIDAKNEVFKEHRSGRVIFKTSFQIPPGIEIDSLLKGENYFITGQKGCGKTALLLYLQELASDRNWSTETVFFRSDVSEAERQQILAGTAFSVVTMRENAKVNYDFMFNWLWLIYGSILRRIEPEWVFQGRDVLSDLKSLLRVKSEVGIRAFDELSVKKVAAKAKLAFNMHFLSGELSADIDAVRAVESERLPFEIIQIVERYINKIRILPKYRVLLFFDELELFWTKLDQRERDLALIRDLIKAVSRTNRNLNLLGSSVVVYASVRSEVIEEINQISPETARDVDDFGVTVNWNVKATSANQPILDIVESKIEASEIEYAQTGTEEIWRTYFPETIFGKNAGSYLLDVSMFKPRFIVMRLNLAKSYDADKSYFSAESFEETSTPFSVLAWREVSEQLLQIYSQKQIANLKEILSGWRSQFKLDDLETRVSDLNVKSPGVSDGFRSRSEINRIFRSLFENGAVGNRFKVSEHGKSQSRDRWAFRGNTEPIYDQPFVIHESLRKYFQLLHD